MTSTRTFVRPARTGAVVLLAALLTAGCSKPPRPKPAAKAGAPAGPTPAAESPPSPTLSVPAAPPAPTGDPAADARASADAFLKAVAAGTATPAMLTPEFKKVIAEPVFSDDVAKGYSDDAAGQWLARFRGSPAPPVADVQGTGEAYVLAVRGGPDRVDLRVVRSGGGWLADWYVSAPTAGSETPLPGGEAAFRAFAAVAFLDALAGKDDRLAEGLMTPRYKAELAPPFGSDKRGYNRGTLANKLAGFRGVAAGAHVTKVDGGIVTGESGGKKSFILKLVRGGRPWDWLVDDVTTD